ncbi:DUF2971 domain-containing protein [Pseudoxanthomonas sp.]|uniref:DUF2971 domain-containing protein n=1 Tax=Pseudoxanthomonas sp. TaxID=1871049 RepID=UPI002633DBB6|nr:DUF2971 domain-containing protein [Pseudoxanthomonas sp.]WDS36082.1 MAG: DUF2971 domain-containing protein [Pseudoxanthomonas sp.]
MIYKYLSPARVSALRNATLRATQANALNDPFEVKPFFEAAIQRHELHERLRDKGMLEDELKKAFAALPADKRPPISPEQFVQFIRTDVVREQVERFLGLELDRFFDDEMPALTEHLRNLMHSKLGCIVGIVSFSEDPAQQLMWAHYADSHKGFVLGFDESHPFFDRRRSESDEFFHLRPVDYFDPLPVYSSISELDGVKLLCAKHGDWRYENEQRILVPLPEEADAEAIHLIDFPRQALVTVILGERTPPSVVAEVREILGDAAYAHVSLQQARVDLGSRQIRTQAI